MRTYCVYSVLCGDLNEKKIQNRDICVHIADSPCCTVETNNIVKQLYSSEIYVCIYIDTTEWLNWSEHTHRHTHTYTHTHTHIVQWFSCTLTEQLHPLCKNKKENKIPLIPLGKKKKQKNLKLSYNLVWKALDYKILLNSFLVGKLFERVFCISCSHFLLLSNSSNTAPTTPMKLIFTSQQWPYYWMQSFQFSHSVVSESLRPHGLQHTRLPCPSPTPEACSNSYPSIWWCHPTISSSVVPFSSSWIQ